jgi:hypothetical protein
VFGSLALEFRICLSADHDLRDLALPVDRFGLGMAIGKVTAWLGLTVGAYIAPVHRHDVKRFVWVCVQTTTLPRHSFA